MGLRAKTFLHFWIFLEINILRFILLCFSLDFKIIRIKYFLIQGFFSSSLLFVYMLYSLLPSPELLKFLLIIIILGKLGIPPFFLWFINIITISSFEIIFFLSTWQKILPLFRGIFFFFNLEIVLFFTTLLCLLGSSIQLLLKKLLAFSSIFNLLWAFLVMENFFILFFFILIYILSMLWVCKSFKDIKNKDLISDLFFIRITENQKLIIILRIFALAGIPPFLIFNGKILIIIYSILFIRVKRVWILFLLVATLPIIYFYMRIVFYLTSRKKVIFTNRINFSQIKRKNLFFNKIFSLIILFL